MRAERRRTVKPRGEAAREEVARALRERLHAAESEMEAPPGLWERIRAAEPSPGASPATSPEAPGAAAGPDAAAETRHRHGYGGAYRPGGGSGLPLLRRPPSRYALIAVAAVAVALVVTGTWWLISGRPAGRPEPAGPPIAATSVTLRVHNAESPCRRLRTLECALRLARNPYVKYAAQHNSAGRVWHGDRVAAHCVVTDGQNVTDESGLSSTRWYLVTKKDGTQGWLPGARTRNSKEVRTCTASERPPRSG